MSNLYLKCELDIFLSDQPAVNKLEEKYKDGIEYSIYLNCLTKLENREITIRFELEQSNLVQGKFKHKLIGTDLNVICKGIFKVDVRTNYRKVFLSKDEKWIFGSFGNYEQDLHQLTVKEGLDGEIYRYKMRGEEKEGIRYPVIVKTNDRKKNLI